jgi:hypothetical protein
VVKLTLRGKASGGDVIWDIFQIRFPSSRGRQNDGNSP